MRFFSALAVRAADNLYLSSFVLCPGTAMATFTANLQCCRMDSLFAGASTCVSTSAGLYCGIEGEPLCFHRRGSRSLRFPYCQCGINAQM